MESGRKVEVIWLGEGTHTPSRRYRSRGRYHKLGDPPWGTKGLGHVLGTLTLGSNTRKMSPLSWFENQWDLLEGYKQPRLSS